MRANTPRAILTKSVLALFALLLLSGVAVADSSINLTASSTSATLPDGQTVPMWGYSCGAVVSGSTATCAATNPKAATSWSPVVITVPAGTALTINLTNKLPVPPGATAGIPTSLVVVGQLGGGLGSTATTTVSPAHATLGTSWPVAGGASGPQFTPPAQGPRVQSFSTEVANGATTALTWSNLKPGTYLIESGTHPSIQGPMGLYGVLVVTTAPSGGIAGTAYPATASHAAVTYNAEVPLLLSEIDPVQNAAVNAAVNTAGFSETAVWSGQPGGCGNPASTTYHTCYPPAVNYDPRYYLINGASFDRTNAANSLFPAAPATATGTLLVRLVNAGLRMHVPSIVGAQTTDSSNATINGFSLVAEDGNVLPGNPKIQNEVFLAAGKTYDVLLNAPASGASALPVFDRQLSLSTNNRRDGGMQAYLQINGGVLPSANTNAVANADSYYLVTGNSLSVADPSKGVIANDIGVYGVQVLAGPTGGTLTLNANGTFSYVPNAGTITDSFTYCANGTVTGPACSTGLTATVTLAACTGTCMGAAPQANNDNYTSTVATRLHINPPGVLSNDIDPAGHPLTVDTTSIAAGAGVTVSANADGSFSATTATPGTYTFTYKAKNSQSTLSAPATVTLNFPAPSNLAVNVKDAKNGLPISDYRWIIEEDRTFYIDPKCQINSTDTSIRPASCPPLPVQSMGYNFHTAAMPVVATGCVGAISCESGQTLLGTAAACDDGNGVCHTDASQKVELQPSQVYLDPTKRYYISILPGDGINPTIGGAGTPQTINGKDVPFNIARDCGPYAPGADAWVPGGSSALCGHGMGGAPLAAGQTSVSIGLQETPLPTAQIAVFVYEDDNPLNGENDAGGGVDILAPNEPGLGSFEIKLWDQAGGLGDATGQITYDMFNMPVSNSLAGKIDPITGLNACPITASTDGLVGMVPTCPTYESDGKTMSPLAGQAVIANLYPGLYEVVATPASDRIGRGEEWLQTNTLDGGKAHEAFIKPAEPSYFQEFGPGGFHVMIGFANPKIINDRKTNAQKTGICDPFTGKDPVTGINLGGGGLTCTSTLTGKITNARMSRTPDQRIYSSGSYDAYSFTQCYVGLGAPDEADFAFAKCDPDGNFTFTNIPQGNFKLTVFDQWNDIMLDGLVSQVKVDGANVYKEFPVTQWRTNLYTRTFIDTNGDGVSQPAEPGLPLVSTNIRYRDGSYGFFNNTDLNGYAGFNEVFPFMNWLVVEADSTRYKPTGVHVVYDFGGPADGFGGGTSTIASGLANTLELNSVPANLRVPGAVYCTDADCSTASILNGTYYNPSGSSGPATNLSTGRIDPPWATTQGWQGLLGQSSFIEFGMKPFAAAGTDTSGVACTAPNTPTGCNANYGKPTLAENGGIKGHVIYASTRPFDDPSLLLQLQWEPGVAHVKINLYQEGSTADGTTSLKLVDSTTTTSWDDWAQGFRSDGMPNMNCPGQDPTSPFFATLQGSTQFLDPSSPKKALPNNAQFKCYDGWSMLNQVQPAPYDGMYKFPSVTAIDPATGRPAGTNCTACVDNPTGDGTKMLPPGKYVVEVIVPPGFELVKEEDKNILMGDVYIASVTQQFAGLGNIFILPDQAAMNAYYNANNPQNPTSNLGSTTFPRHEGDTGSMEAFWPCVGATRIVPDYMSLFPGAGQVAPFAGASRPLCDRKEVTLTDQMAALAKFYIFTPTHVAGHFTGTMTNDLASEFDPFSPQFGEKFGPPNLPVAMRDFAGNEVSRVYGDQWGIYNGLYFSSWEVNPPNPTGYAPQMSIACMNDPGPIPGPNGTMITDPNYSPAYSNFCYEMSFMPGFTAYMDTPVVPTMAFAEGYNLPDTEYPDATPAIGSVTGSDGIAGPWVSNAGSGHTLTITSLGDKAVQNPAFSGPNATAAPFNQKTVTRHYGFGATAGTVTIGGVNATVNSWSDSSITVTVPTISSTLNTATGVGSTCYSGNSTTIPAGQTPPQRGVSGAAATNYRCGELVISAANGKKSIDAITVTVAGKTPTYVTPASPGSGLFGQVFANPLQTAIDNASPGDLIIVGPGTYKENLLMWKPVRLQGVGAAAVTINADAHPAGKMDPWRRQVNCLFGLTIDGAPNPNNSGFDPSGTYACPSSMFMRSDRIPFEGFVGWDASSNGNLAQVLQEPTLMGAYEGAGVTVLGRGIRIPTNSNDFWGQAPAGAAETAGAFPDGSTYLTNSNTNCTASTTSTNGRDYGTGNFKCNPSRIDGVSIINSSQGGGAIFMHGWNHYMEIANTRVSANTGTLSGGINVGNGETPPAYINDGTICGPGVAAPAPLCPPLQGTPTGAQIPFGLNVNVHVHHNAIVANASLGDALFSGTPSGAGGITFSAGDDNYKLDHNWISGNLSNGDGAGVEHSGFSVDGNISNNWVLFNQSTNPTLPTNGGGIGIIGANTDRTLPNGQECGTFTDVDCPPGIGDGTGPGLVIDANLIMGNSAEGGSGGGLRLQQVNGSEVGAFPLNSARWYDVTVTNNVIANNVAGWDGGGVSLEDALKVSLINNTVVSNDTTGSAGVLFKTLGAPMASSPPPGCTPNPDPTAPQDPSCTGTDAPSVPQPAGLVTMTNTPNMRDSLPANVNGTQMRCPTGYGYGSGNALNDGSCRSISLPKLENNLFWQNRAFHIEITGFGTGLQSQQHLVTLVPTLNQASTGNCASGANYWDVGARGDISPADHSGGGTFSMSNSILTSLTGGYTGNGNLAPATSPVIAQYCNGSRVPPENGGKGYNAPAGRSETTGLSPVFELFNITPAATVDEGNNWINLSYGPLTLYSTAGQTMVASNGNTLGAYSIASGSPAVNNGSNAGAPATDFFGNARPRTNANPSDIGAVEFAGVIGGGGASATLTPATWTVSQVRNCPGTNAAGRRACASDPAQVLTLTNTGSSPLTGIAQAALSGSDASSFTIVRLLSTCGPTGNGQLIANTTLAPGASCTVTVQFQPLTSQPTGVKNATVSVTDAAGTQSSTLTGTAQ